MRKYILLISMLCLIGYSQADTFPDTILIRSIETDFHKIAVDNDTIHLNSIENRRFRTVRTESWGITAGIGLNRNVNIILGYGRAVYGLVGYHHWSFTNIYVGSEFLYQNGNFLVAPKISAWANGGSAGMAMGLNLLYYTNFSHYNNLVFRPEIGFGFGKFKLVWGYNISLNRTAFDMIRRNNISFVWYFDTNNKRTTRF